MNELEFFLLKLHLCNLDLKNELRVVRYMLSFERCPSKDELFLLLKLGQTQKNDLWNALQSKQLSQKLSLIPNSEPTRRTPISFAVF